MRGRGGRGPSAGPQPSWCGTEGVRTDSTRTRSDQVPSPQNPAGAALRANTRVLRASTAWCGPAPLHPLQLLPVTMCCCFWNTQSVLLSQGLRSCHFLCLECSLFGPRHVCLTFQVTTTLYRIVPPLLPAPIPTTVCFKREEKQTNLLLWRISNTNQSGEQFNELPCTHSSSSFSN